MDSYENADILARMTSSLKNQKSNQEGTFCTDNLQAVSQEISRMYYMEVATIPDKYFLATAENEDLDLVAVDYGMTRNPATPAEGLIVVYGNEGTLIPKNTFIKSEMLSFSTVDDMIITVEGKAEGKAICTTLGSAGNIEPGQIEVIDNVDIIGTVTTTNIEKFQGGTDEETDDAFRQRIIDKIRYPSTGGNERDYVTWAKEVSGVGSAVTIPTWAGNGTVKVVVIGVNGQEIDNIILKKVEDHIADNRPIGAEITISKARSKMLVIDGNISLKNGYDIETVKVEFINLLNDYLSTKDLGISNSLPFLKISDVLYSTEGIQDVFSYTINGQSITVTAASDEFFAIQEVVLHEV